MFAEKLRCYFENVNYSALSKKEKILLEAELFTRVCEELKKIFKVPYKNYFSLMKFNIEMENTVMETNYVRCIINDILATEEYSLAGIAYYTDKPQDVIIDIAAGKNSDPSSSLLRKIIELHRSVRPTLYQEIIKKIMLDIATLK
ncbi:MAG: hypothetical protein ACD_44C00148G0006 [uncultured bacterium]|nr:MAG: hypothetical protein ACD_44C00148G0006 [uncultured bacterium]